MSIRNLTNEEIQQISGGVSYINGGILATIIQTGETFLGGFLNTTGLGSVLSSAILSLQRSGILSILPKL